MRDLNLRGTEVTQVAFGYEFVLLLWPTSGVWIGGPFAFKTTADMSPLLSPEAAVEHAHELASLFGTSITESGVSDALELQLTFSNGLSLVVPPSYSGEAFRVRVLGDDPRMIVSMPGGELDW